MQLRLSNVKILCFLMFFFFAADEYGQCVTESGLFVVSFLRAAGAGLYGDALYTSGVHTLSCAVELCNVFHVPQNVVSQMVQRVCTNVTYKLSGWPVWV